MQSPPREIEELKKKGTKDWQNVNPGFRDICEDSVHKIKQRLLKRGIMLKPSFRDYDKYWSAFMIWETINNQFLGKTTDMFHALKCASVC